MSFAPKVGLPSSRWGAPLSSTLLWQTEFCTLKLSTTLPTIFSCIHVFLMHPCFPEQDRGSIQRLETLVVLTDVFLKTIRATRWHHHTMSNQPLIKRKNLWLLSKALTSLLHLYFCLNRWLPTNPCADTNDIIAMKNKRSFSLTHTHSKM